MTHDPLATRRAVTSAVGSVLVWRAGVALLGGPAILGTAIGLLAPVGRAVLGRLGRQVPMPVEAVFAITSWPGDGIASWAYPEDLVLLPPPDEDR